MYPYNDPGAWEYKMMHAPRGEFARQEHLAALLKQESRAGWSLDEVCSERYVRLRRPRHTRAWDTRLPRSVEPYRTTFGPAPEVRLIHLLFFAACALMAVVAVICLVVVANLPG
jgi:hypothetical protein